MGKFKTVFGKILGLDDKGWEAPDPKPVALHVGLRRPPTLQEQMARFISNHQRMIKNAGFETLEEANDFDMPEEGVDFHSEHEVDEHMEETYKAHRQKAADEKAAALLRAKYKKPVQEPSRAPKKAPKTESEDEE